MNKYIYFILIAIGVFFTLLLGLDGIYIGLFATEAELAQYPWGTELGWSYRNKTNYMFKGILIAALSWLPFIIYVLIKHLTRKSTTRVPHAGRAKKPRAGY